MAHTFFMLAGEASGDLHGSNLIRALKKLEPDAKFVGMGGDLMIAAGLDAAKDLDGMQVVGLLAVIKKYGFFRDVFFKLLDRIKQERPSALICVDYPGFNLRFAKEVGAMGIPILYYIVPQVWAWKPLRAARMGELVDRAYTVFDFELSFFERYRPKKNKMKTIFVGHPILDAQNHSIPDIEVPENNKVVGILPGSRPDEILAHCGPLEDAIQRVQKNVKGLSTLWSLPPKEPHKALGKLREVEVRHASPEKSMEGFSRIIYGHLGIPDTQRWFDRTKMSDLELKQFSPIHVSHSSFLAKQADFSVVKSGTSTLEAGLQGNPMCGIYRAGRINFGLARILADIPVFTLVNIVLGKYVVPELSQEDVCGSRIASEILRGLTDPDFIEKQRAELAELPGKLGGPGASDRTAKAMLDFLKGRPEG